MGRVLRVGVIPPYRCRVSGNSRSEQSSSFFDVVALSATAPDPVNDSRCFMPWQRVFWSHHLTPHGGLRSVCNSNPKKCKRAVNGLGDFLDVRNRSPEFRVGMVLSLVSFAHSSVDEVARIAEHAAAVRRNDANSQVAAHSTKPGHTFKFDGAEILARGDNRVNHELFESWFTGPQSINKCNDMPTANSVLRHRLAKVLDHSGRAQAGEPDDREIITPASNTDDDISVINNLHAGQLAISAPVGNDPS
nr:unnamed protein product [Spirometra erinaceieuropaei]